MSAIWTSYLSKYIDDLAAFVISQYRSVNGLQDFRKFRPQIDAVLGPPNYSHSYVSNSCTFRKAVPKVSLIPPLPPLQLMFDEATIQKLTTVALSATATFMLAFTIRLISGRLHPQLRNSEDDTSDLFSDGFRPLSPSSQKHPFPPSSGSSKKNIVTTHQGQCRCSRVRFCIRASSELHAIVTDNQHVSLFPRILVSSEEFMWQADAQALNMISTGEEGGDATTAGAHFLCSDCGVEVAFMPSVSNNSQNASEERISMILQVNLDCLDTSHITCIHHHHVSTVPPAPEQQSFQQRFQQLQQQQNAHLAASKTVLNRNVNHSLGQVHAHYPVHPDSQQLPEAFHGYEFDDDDEDEGDEIRHQGQHFALNMQLNSLGHFSRNRSSNSSSNVSDRRRSHGSTPTSGNKYNGVFFPDQSSPLQTQYGFIQKHQQHIRQQQQFAMDNNAPGSDTTEELFFDQFYAPASPFSPPITVTAASARANSHFPFHPTAHNHSNSSSNHDNISLDNRQLAQYDNSTSYMSQLQYILEADSSTATAKVPQVLHTPPRVTPNKTHRAVHSTDNQSHHPHRSHVRGDTSTSIDTSPGHSQPHSQSNSRSHSGTSSPASTVSNNAGSLGTAGSIPRRFHNYDPHVEHLAQAGPMDSEVTESVSKRKNSRSLFANNNASTLLVSDVLRDEYGNELDLSTLLESGEVDHLEDTTSHSEQSSIQTLQTLPTHPLNLEPGVFPMTDELTSLVDEVNEAGDSVSLHHSQVVVSDHSSITLGTEDDGEDSPSNLWQRRHVTMRKSTPGRLHTQQQRGSHYRYQSTQQSASKKHSTSSFGGNSEDSVDTQLDFPMYQNLKRYLDRHLSPSAASNSKSATDI